MKDIQKKRISISIVWLMQFITTLLFSLVLSLSLLLGTVLHVLCMYVIMPLIGAYSAYRCVLHNGMNNYLSIIAPILMFPTGYLLIWGYLPNFAPVLVCTLITVIGAAAGEVTKTQIK